MYTALMTLLLSALPALASSAGLAVITPAETEPEAIVLRAYVFYSPGCNTCKLVQRPKLTRMAEDMRCKIELKYFDINDLDNYDFLTRVERALGDENNKIPALAIGQTILSGEQEIRQRLQDVLLQYAAQGGCDWPEVAPVKKDAPPARPSNSFVSLVFFYKPGCLKCQRAHYLINRLEQQRRDVLVLKFNLADPQNKALCEALGEAAGVPVEKRMSPASIFVGQDYLLGDDITDQALARLIDKQTGSGTKIPDFEDQDIEGAKNNIKERFETLGPLAVLGAGLIDGVNPCAFATIVSFIYALSLVGKKGRDILLVGIVFTVAVFLTYLAVGLGAFGFIQQLSAYESVSIGIRWLTMIAAFILAGLSFSDFLKTRQGRLEQITLQLPKSIKRRIRLAMSRHLRTRNVVLAAAIVGSIVSLLEHRLECG